MTAAGDIPKRILGAVLGAILTAYPGGLQAEPADRGPRPFAADYLGIEVVRNYPMSFAQNRFSPSVPHPLLAYRHLVGEDWLMGASAQFRLFERRQSEAAATGARHLALWSVHHEAYRIIRLDHPVYLMIGPKISYLLPVRAATFPMTREPNYATEVGAGLSLAVAKVISPDWLVALRADRWRGTRTTKFMGLEVALSINKAL